VDVAILCKTNFDCTNNAECVDGQCFCQQGFLAQGAGCVDIDECLGQPCGAYAACTNTPGGFHCECEGGYIGAPPRMPCKGMYLIDSVSTALNRQGTLEYRSTCCEHS